ncbi:hypothetical protein [Coleofasciculus sp. H7-2]|uniref:hypothetical protein n=1 Tax=Coleofasciculus sp. H7-2 TaxID=3351545 RepID=UPI00366C66FC
MLLKSSNWARSLLGKFEREPMYRAAIAYRQPTTYKRHICGGIRAANLQSD